MFLIARAIVCPDPNRQIKITESFTLYMAMEIKNNVIRVTIKKYKNKYLTVIENIPTGNLSEILAKCKSKFGCGGKIDKSTEIPSIHLQGDQKINITRYKSDIFGEAQINISS